MSHWIRISHNNQLSIHSTSFELIQYFNLSLFFTFKSANSQKLNKFPQFSLHTFFL